ncbi:MAG: hypothetical protein KC502_18285 [Myxococcales bacterium]|nr:hypothetical protein [Myxococcales bacterium]
MGFRTSLLPLLMVASLAACGSTDDPASAAASDAGAGAGDAVAGADAGQTTCVPSRSIFDKVTKDHIEAHCGTCHGTTPNFGAPNTLTGSYESLVAGKVGERLVDRIAHLVGKKMMPPTGGEPIPHQVQDTLVEWASCGEQHPDHSIGLVVDKPVFGAPEKPPEGLKHFDLTAGKFPVGEDVLDLYQCFTFEVPVTKDQFVRRIEVVIDQSKVLHHVVLLKDPKKKYALGKKKCKGMPADSQYLYAWAPGAGSIEFPEGGMRVKPGEHYILQVHYNNGAGVKDVKDSSGVRIYYGPTEGTEYGMIAPGPLVFSIPAKSKITSTGHCLVKEKTTILAGMPHMHEIGTAFEQVIVRADGTREPMISLTGWDFEMQPFYKIGATLNPGDRLETSCTWNNTTSATVNVGTGTADEMCFDFMFVTPPPKSAYCNSYFVEKDPDVTYTPGPCAPKDATAQPPKTVNKLKLGLPDTAAGGDLGKHHWELTGATFVLPEIAKQYVNLETSQLVGRGQAWTDGDRLTIDARVRILLQFGNQGSDSVDHLSASGVVVKGDKAGQGTWKLDCGPKEPQELSWTIKGDELVVQLKKSLAQFVMPAEYRFKRK